MTALGGRSDDRVLQLRRKALAARLREIRAGADLSQTALADRSGVDRSYISDLERGAKRPTVDRLGALADALGVHVTELLSDRRSGSVDSPH